MFGMTSIQELIMLMLVIGVLSMSGLWPRIVQGLRDIRGDNGGTIPSHDMEMCYKILGLSSTATWNDVEKAYRQKAKLHHPDKGGDEDTMRALNEAYARLKGAQ